MFLLSAGKENAILLLFLKNRQNTLFPYNKSEVLSMFILMAGLLLIVVVAVVIAIVSAAAAAVATEGGAEDEE